MIHLLNSINYYSCRHICTHFLSCKCCYGIDCTVCDMYLYNVLYLAIPVYPSLPHSPLNGWHTRTNPWFDYLSHGQPRNASIFLTACPPVGSKCSLIWGPVKEGRINKIFDFEFSQHVGFAYNTSPPYIFSLHAVTHTSDKMKEVCRIDMRNLPLWCFCDVWEIL